MPLFRGAKPDQTGEPVDSTYPFGKSGRRMVEALRSGHDKVAFGHAGTRLNEPKRDGGEVGKLFWSSKEDAGCKWTPSG